MAYFFTKIFIKILFQRRHLAQFGDYFYQSFNEFIYIFFGIFFA